MRQQPSPAPVAKHNLPAPVSSFVGRERDLIDLRAMLAHHRLVTLTGVGGIGKTRLALRLAAEVLDAHADGVWFVDLAPVSDPRLVANAVAMALGVREEPGRPVSETLQQFVAGRGLMLVLDNCEHLLAACAQLAWDLLHAGPKITILATSREPLHVPGEATFSLPTLPAPDPGHDLAPDALSGYPAVRLFVARAIDARSDFALTPQNAAAVTRICYDLDGIPLALELAAARIRSMSAVAIAGHLTDRFTLLKGGDRTALPRQQTLRATIDWSYDLLAPPERVLLQRLSVFAGGFALDGAEAIGAGGDISSAEVLDTLDHLIDKSLVAFDAPRERYRLLETVRQYARDRLVESGHEAPTLDLHLSYYGALAELARGKLDGPEQAAWGARLDAERENILLAFDRARIAPGGGAAGLAMVCGFNQWFGWGLVETWRPVVLETLAHPDAQRETVARCRALYVGAQVTYLTGRHDESFALAQSSVRIARACGDPQVLAEALYRLGYVAIAVDHGAEAHEHFVEGLALARQASDSVLVALHSSGLGELCSQQGQFELAETHFLEALRADRGAPPGGTLCTLANLARNAIALRAEAKAVRYLREAVATGGARDSVLTIDPILVCCAGLAALREEWAFALRLSGAAALHREQHGLLGLVVEAQFHAASMAPARAALGDRAADAAFATGQALSTEVALREAEAWLDALPPDEPPP